MTTLEESNVTYEQLADLEKEFEDAELEITRQQAVLMKPLYEKREKTVAEIPNFWPLVFEQAPQDVDTYIQPSDSAVLSTALKSISVSRFEVEGGGKGDPRSIAVKFEFSDNEYFENKVLEKKFWYRHSKDGEFQGLVSEPVPIKWKAGKDLTEGLMDMAISVYEQEKKAKKSGPTKAKDFTPEQKALQKKIQGMGMGGVSFFAFFGFRGYPVSEEESRAAIQKENEERRLRAEGKSTASKGEDEDDEAPELIDVNGEEDEEDDEVLEIFPDGEELAVAIAEDLWPNALKFFAQAQEQDGISEMDFEESGGEEDDDEEDQDQDQDQEERPAKKRKA